jgi:hypothetical protein
MGTSILKMLDAITSMSLQQIPALSGIMAILHGIHSAANNWGQLHLDWTVMVVRLFPATLRKQERTPRGGRAYVSQWL